MGEAETEDMGETEVSRGGVEEGGMMGVSTNRRGTRGAESKRQRGSEE